MKIQKGTSRIVFVFPQWGFVIKFPLIRLLQVVIMFISRKPAGWKWFLKWQVFHKMNSNWDNLLGLLFMGLNANLNEFYFYLKTKNVFLQPTYFSFFGLFNVQKYDKLSSFNSIDLSCQLQSLTELESDDDIHCFSKSDNFCYVNGVLKLLDYGNADCHRVIRKYGEKIVKNFDPNYSWERICREEGVQI